MKIPGSYDRVIANGEIYSVNSLKKSSDGYYVISYAVSAKNLDDKLNIFLLESGESESSLEGTAPFISYSVRDYLESVIADNKEHYSEELYNLCVALNNYGYAAQNYFGYGEYVDVSINTDNALEGIDTIYVDGDIVEIEYIGMSLLLKDTVTYRYYFRLLNSDTDLTEVWCMFNDSIGYEVDGELELYKMKNMTATIAYSDIPYISYNSLGATSEIKIGGMTGELEIYGANALAYARLLADTKGDEDSINLLYAMYYYNEAAKAYTVNN